MTTLTYEEYLDEVTTVLTELYDLDDEAAIKLVVAAQDAEFFVPHDAHEAMRTVEQAKKDAVTLFERKQNRQQTQEKQQQRVRQLPGKGEIRCHIRSSEVRPPGSIRRLYDTIMTKSNNKKKARPHCWNPA